MRTIVSVRFLEEAQTPSPSPVRPPVAPTLNIEDDLIPMEDFYTTHRDLFNQTIEKLRRTTPMASDDRIELLRTYEPYFSYLEAKRARDLTTLKPRENDFLVAYRAEQARQFREAVQRRGSDEDDDDEDHWDDD